MRACTIEVTCEIAVVVRLDAARVEVMVSRALWILPRRVVLWWTRAVAVCERAAARARRRSMEASSARVRWVKEVGAAGMEGRARRAVVRWAVRAERRSTATAPKAGAEKPPGALELGG